MSSTGRTQPAGSRFMSIAVGTRRPLVELVGVSKTFRVRLGSHGHGQLRAVDDVDLLVEEGATVGLVGESGSGKSTVARLALRLVDPTSGRVRLAGTDITDVKGRELRALRQTMQLVFQDPNSFDPLASIGDSIAEALRTHQDLDRDSRRLRIEELFNLVGLSRRLTGRNPRELSGGQLQRASLARAHARPLSGRACEQRPGGYVFGPHCRKRPEPGDSRVAFASVHPRSAVRIASCRSKQTSNGPYRSHRRHSFAPQSAEWLPVPHSLPLCHVGLLGGRSGTRDRRSGHRALPLV